MELGIPSASAKGAGRDYEKDSPCGQKGERMERRG